MMNQGEGLRLVIWLHGYSQEEVAKECVVSRGHLSNIINNVDPLEMDLARSIGSLLGVVPGRLLQLDQAPMRRKRANKKGKSRATTRKS